MTRYQSAYSAAELAEQEYIESYGECGIETIVESWLDTAPKLPHGTRMELRTELFNALMKLSELEIAQWAAEICGNPDFETWMGDRS